MMNREEMLSLWKNGMSYADIGRQAGVSRQRVYQIIRSSSEKWYANLKKEVFERDRYICQWGNKCTGEAARYNLIVHHVDNDPSNNDLSNLITLCKHCHLSFHGLTTERIKKEPKPERVKNEYAVLLGKKSAAMRKAKYGSAAYSEKMSKIAKQPRPNARKRKVSTGQDT